MEKTINILNEQQCRIDISRKKASFSRIRSIIEDLKSDGLPIYWDILYNHLDGGGDALSEEYMKRFAKETYQNYHDAQVKNNLMKVFSMLADPFHRYSFGKKFVTLHEDGSFSINEEAIGEHYRDEWTYTITEEQQQAIKDICRSLDILKIPAMGLHGYFSRDIDGITKPIGYNVHALLSGKIASKYE